MLALLQSTSIYPSVHPSLQNPVLSLTLYTPIPGSTSAGRLDVDGWVSGAGWDGLDPDPDPDPVPDPCLASAKLVVATAGSGLAVLHLLLLLLARLLATVPLLLLLLLLLLTMTLVMSVAWAGPVLGRAGGCGALAEFDPGLGEFEPQGVAVAAAAVGGLSIGPSRGPGATSRGFSLGPGGPSGGSDWERISSCTMSLRPTL